MAVVETMSVRRAVLPTSPRTTRTKKTAMTIVAESGGTALSIPYAPKDVTHTNLINEYVTVPRPSLLENVIYSHPMRPRMTFDLEVHDKRQPGSTTAQKAITVIQTLQSMAKKGRVRISYGKLESGLWWIVDMSVKSERRDPMTDEITGATVSLSLVLSTIATATSNTGPTTGGSKSAPNPATSVIDRVKDAVKKLTPATRTYTVKKGDTLYRIAQKYYGNGAQWKRIADANKIKDPKKLAVGKKLRIP